MSPDYNLAERSIRLSVTPALVVTDANVMRKISGGAGRSEGATTRLTFASVFHTWTARNLNPFGVRLSALQNPAATTPS